MHFKIRIVVVGLAGQQRLELAARDFGLEPTQRVLGFGNDLLVLLGFAKFDQRHLIVELLRDADRSRDWDLRTAGSARQAVRAPCRRQRCLLSSATDCLISPTITSISARMAMLQPAI